MRTIDKNGMRLSQLTLGTVQLGMPYGIANKSGMPSEEQSFAILDEAWNGGVVSYDTATAYGRSEAILGRYFAGKQPTLITKMHIRPPAGAGGAEVERLMYGMAETALSNLKVSSVPLLMLHNTDVLGPHGDAVAAGFERLKRDGLIGCAGISIGSNTAEEYRVIGERLFDDTYEAVQLPMNLLDHRPIRNGVIKRLSDAGKAVFVRSLFLQGLVYLDPEQLPEHLQEAAAPLSALRELSELYGIPVGSMAMAFIRDLKGVDSLVVGAETPEQVRENISLLKEAPPLPELLTLDIMRLFADMPERIITPHLWSKSKS